MQKNGWWQKIHKYSIESPYSSNAHLISLGWGDYVNAVTDSFGNFGVCYDLMFGYNMVVHVYIFDVTEVECNSLDTLRKSHEDLTTIKNAKTGDFGGVEFASFNIPLTESCMHTILDAETMPNKESVIAALKLGGFLEVSDKSALNMEAQAIVVASTRSIGPTKPPNCKKMYRMDNQNDTIDFLYAVNVTASIGYFEKCEKEITIMQATATPAHHNNSSE